MTAKQRKIIFSITVVYTVLILYFIFLGFGRLDTVERTNDYTFIFLPDSFFRVPSLSELLQPTLMSLVDFGNFAAFIPFGILIPLLYRISFIRFIAMFLLSIFIIETIQALTLLGSFDMNDVIQNTLGAAIGFGAYKIGFRTKNVWGNFAITGLSAIVILAGVGGVFGIIDNKYTQELGPFVAINELKDSRGNTLIGTKLNNFKVGGQNVEPKYNLFSFEGKSIETYTYKIGKREHYLYLNYGIPDQKDWFGSIIISIDGEEYLSKSADGQRGEPDMFQVYVDRGKEVTITISGNASVWDLGFREMKYEWK
ncbi:VanZ family protein [Paenibacillus sp. GCM10027627]|uniref:VanZ family protein n=1 Tax=unclassified Paenibacillus TaxID=185978 RepID=UPI00363B3ABF